MHAIARYSRVGRSSASGLDIETVGQAGERAAGSAATSSTPASGRRPATRRSDARVRSSSGPTIPRGRTRARRRCGRARAAGRDRARDRETPVGRTGLRGRHRGGLPTSRSSGTTRRSRQRRHRASAISPNNAGCSPNSAAVRSASRSDHRVGLALVGCELADQGQNRWDVGWLGLVGSRSQRRPAQTASERGPRTPRPPTARAARG